MEAMHRLADRGVIPRPQEGFIPALSEEEHRELLGVCPINNILNDMRN